MLHYFLVFVVIALVAALFGFGAVSGIAWQVGLIFLALFVIFMILRMIGTGGPSDPSLP